MKKIVSVALTLALALLAGCAANGSNSAGYIGVESAKQIAFGDAGVAETELSKLSAELDLDNPRAVYEIDFSAAGYEYEYDVDAVSGEIVREKREADDDAKLPEATSADLTPYEEPPATEPEATSAPESETEPAPEATSAPETTPAPETTKAAETTNPAETTKAPDTAAESDFIGFESAKKIALEHAGLKESDVYDLDTELDRERGITVYDVSFDSAGYDYDYEIDAVSGAILRSDKERDGDYRVPDKTAAATTAGNYISRDKAKSIALEHAGVSESQVYDLEVDLDSERGTMVYEVSFDASGYEYDYDINATTGEIIKSKKDRD